MDRRIPALLKQVRRALQGVDVRVERFIVFGSHVYGTPKEHSDIDVAIISDDFETMNLLERLETIGLALAKARIMAPIEPLAYTQGELEAAREGSFLADEVKERGVEVL